MAKDTKTEAILLLLQILCKTTGQRLSQKTVKDIFGNPPDSTFYRNIKELLEDSGVRSALLTKVKDDDGNIWFQLNHCEWLQFLEGTHQIQFMIKAFKDMGYLFPKFEMNIPATDVKNLERKFYYHAPIKAKSSEEKSIIVEEIIKSLVGERKLNIIYNNRAREICPLTICQYRDDLYLMAYDGDIRDKSIKHFKISRIEMIIPLEGKFKYPSFKDWDPKSRFKKSSGIVLYKEEKVTIRVFDKSRQLIKEKDFFNSFTLSTTKDYDEYEMTFTNKEEFIGQLFVYGQDIEILGNDDLRLSLINKAEKIVARNHRPKMVS